MEFATTIGIEKGVFPFSISAIELALTIDQRGGSVIIIGDDEPSQRTIQALLSACDAVPKVVYISASNVPDLSANVINVREFGDLPHQVLLQADAIVLLGTSDKDIAHDSYQMRRFARAIRGVDLTAEIAFFETMSFDCNFGMAWVRNKGVSRFNLGW